jgi:hypothetical protein
MREKATTPGAKGEIPKCMPLPEIARKYWRPYRNAGNAARFSAILFAAL